MSAWPGKRTLDGVSRTSAWSRFRPKCVTAKTRSILFDHLLGSNEYRCWNCKAEHLRCFHVEDQFKSGRLLDCKFVRLFTAKYADDVVGRAPEQISYIDSVGHQAALGGKDAIRVNCGQTIALGERINRFAINKH